MRQPRLYQTVLARPCSSGYEVCLDGGPIRTPKGTPLVVTDWQLASRIAEEWDAMRNHVDPSALHHTRIVSSALDEIPERRAYVIGELLAVLQTDLVFFPAASPEALVNRQSALWGPLLQWAESAFGIQSRAAATLAPAPQSHGARSNIESWLCSQSDVSLAALWAATRVSGSIIIALAVAEKVISIEDALRAGFVEEDWQREQWGADEEDERRREAMKAELSAAAGILVSARVA